MEGSYASWRVLRMALVPCVAGLACEGAIWPFHCCLFAMLGVPVQEVVKFSMARLVQISSEWEGHAIPLQPLSRSRNSLMCFARYLLCICILCRQTSEQHCVL